MNVEKEKKRNSPGVQALGRYASTGGGWGEAGSIPGQGTKIPQAKKKGYVGQTQTIKELVASILDKVQKH